MAVSVVYGVKSKNEMPTQEKIGTLVGRVCQPIQGDVKAGCKECERLMARGCFISSMIALALVVLVVITCVLVVKFA